MKFTLTINCDNAAFYTSDGVLFNTDELADLLIQAATKVRAEYLYGETLQDSNGNTVGRFELSEVK